MLTSIKSSIIPLLKSINIRKFAIKKVKKVKEINNTNEITTVSIEQLKNASKTINNSNKSLIHSNDKKNALDQALKQIEITYGKGSIMRADNNLIDHNIDVISTGSLGLDNALGCGGFPKGRIVEVYGPESSGKTTLALHAIAEAQKRGGSCAFIDAEHALDSLYAEKLGINMKDLIVSQPDNGEQALEICETLVRSGGVDVIVIDSVAALTPKAEIEGEMGDAHMALQARLMSQALRKLTAHLSKCSTLLIFINQIRHKVGVMFGSPEVTSGGNALKFYASQRVEIRKTGVIKIGEDVVGNRVKVKVVKNKMASPYREAEFDIEFGHGISRIGELVDMATINNVIVKAGAWFSFNGNQLAQGREKVKELLKNNQALASEIETKLVATLAAKKAAKTTKPDAKSDSNENSENDVVEVPEESVDEVVDDKPVKKL